MDARIFVFEFDLPAAVLDARVSPALAVLHPHEAEFPAAPAQRQIARRLGAGIEMLMEPLIGRHHHAAGFPIDPLHVLAFGPEHRISLPSEDDYMGAGTMLVAFLVSADGELGDVRAHGLAGEIELHVGAALAALAVV